MLGRIASTVFSVVASSVIVGGCGSVVETSNNAEDASGVVYRLPKALLPVELSEDAGVLELSIGEPVMVGDPDHRLILRQNGNAFSSDSVKIEVDENTNLLKSVKVESTDESASTLVKLVSAMKPEAALVQEGKTAIYRGMLDPTSESLAELQTQLASALDQYRVAGAQASCLNDADRAWCEHTGLARSRALGDFSIQVTLLGGDQQTGSSTTSQQSSSLQQNAKPPTHDTGSPPPSECARGLCYRINQSYLITLRGPGGAMDAVVAQLPNLSPTYVLPMERWAFVKSVHDIKFKDGVLLSIDTDRPSSALAVASVPLDITRAVFNTIGELIQFKIDLSGKEKSLATAKAEEIKAKATLDQALLNANQGQAEAALFGRRDSSGKIASVRFGKSMGNSPLPSAAVKPGGKAPVGGGSGARVLPSNDGSNGKQDAVGNGGK